MQMTFDFFAPAKPSKPRKQLTPKQQQARKVEVEKARQEARWAEQRERDRLDARAYWKVGMVVSMPLWGKVRDCTQTYTQMMPGVVEAIAGDIAQVRMYAAPEYGLWMENYPLHMQIADVPLVELGRYGLNHHLARIVSEGRLETGDAELAVRIRAYTANGHVGPRP